MNTSGIKATLHCTGANCSDPPVKGSSPGSTRGLNIRTPVYVGGLNLNKYAYVSGVAVSSGFLGCITDVSFGLQSGWLPMIITVIFVKKDSNIIKPKAKSFVAGWNLFFFSTLWHRKKLSPQLMFGERKVRMAHEGVVDSSNVKDCKSMSLCDRHPCLNGATCTAGEESGQLFTCDCPDGYRYQSWALSVFSNFLNIENDFLHFLPS